MEVQKDNTFKQTDNVSVGSFSALTDRKISQATAQKYGVKLSMTYKVMSLNIFIPTTMDMSYQLPRLEIVETKTSMFLEAITIQDYLVNNFSRAVNMLPLLKGSVMLWQLTNC